MSIETPGQRRERIAEATVDKLTQFCRTNPDLALIPIAKDVAGKRNTLMLLEKKGLAPEPAVINALFDYQASRRGPQDMQNDDCASVAGNANTFLATRGVAVRAISTQNRGEKLPFFKDLGYRHHVVNLVRQRDGSALAVDFSAHYSMDAMQGAYDLFGIHAASEDELRQRMRALYGTSWE